MILKFLSIIVSIFSSIFHFNNLYKTRFSDISMSDNRVFWESIDMDVFRELAKGADDDCCRDMEIAYPFIKDVGSVLELGSGYGRCLNYLIKRDFDGEIHGVDYIDEFVGYLRGRFSPRVVIHNQDVTQMKLDRKFDSILWMGEGVLGFDYNQQVKCLKRCRNMLNKNGLLIIDSLDIDVNGVKSFEEGRRDVCAEYNEMPFNGRFSDEIDFAHLSDECGFNPCGFRAIKYDVMMGIEGEGRGGSSEVRDKSNVWKSDELVEKVIYVMRG